MATWGIHQGGREAPTCYCIKHRHKAVDSRRNGPFVVWKPPHKELGPHTYRTLGYTQSVLTHQGINRVLVEIPAEVVDPVLKCFLRRAYTCGQKIVKAILSFGSYISTAGSMYHTVPAQFPAALASRPPNRPHPASSRWAPTIIRG